MTFTRHGPVIYEDRSRHLAYAIRSVWFEPGTAPYFASIVTMRARSLDEFRAGMTRWGVPATNQVYADASGKIAWMPAAFSPIRPNWDGLLPVPGDGRYEWSGCYTAADLPLVVDPPNGYVATANAPNLPPDWPHTEKQVGYEWLERSRINRLNEVLSESRKQSVAHSCALQTDVLSLPARRLAALIASLPGGGTVSAVRALFAGWDFRLTPECAPAALFEIWWSNHLRPGLMARVAAEPVLSLLLPGDPESVLLLLEQPDARLGVDPVLSRDDLLVETLAAAWRECSRLLGMDAAAWRWGDLHKAHFVHALSGTARPTSEVALDVGPLETGGSDSTPMNALYRTSDYRVTIGASMRIVVDVGGWDNSVCINAPGQSGDPTSDHYGDLAARWAAGIYVPLLYSRDRIDAAAERRVLLKPCRSKPNR